MEKEDFQLKDVVTTVVMRMLDAYAQKLIPGQFTKKDGWFFSKPNTDLDRWVGTSIMLLTVNSHKLDMDDVFSKRGWDASQYKVIPFIQKLADVSDVKWFQSSNVKSDPAFRFDYVYKEIMTPYEYNAFLDDLNDYSRNKALSNAKAFAPTSILVSQLPVVYLDDDQLHEVGTSDSIQDWQVKVLGVKVGLPAGSSRLAHPVDIQEAINDAVETKARKNQHNE